LPERVGPCRRAGRAAEASRREATRAGFDRRRSSPVQARLGGGFANAKAFLLLEPMGCEGSGNYCTREAKANLPSKIASRCWT
jgi:hypothetical protein